MAQVRRFHFLRGWDRHIAALSFPARQAYAQGIVKNFDRRVHLDSTWKNLDDEAEAQTLDFEHCAPACSVLVKFEREADGEIAVSLIEVLPK